MVELSPKRILLVVLMILAVGLPLIIMGIVYLMSTDNDIIWGWLFIGSGVLLGFIILVLLLQLGSSQKYIEQTPDEL